jgi:hypothetical protein
MGHMLLVQLYSMEVTPQPSGKGLCAILERAASYLVISDIQGFSKS